jgi:hypothetical protein
LGSHLFSDLAHCGVGRRTLALILLGLRGREYGASRGGYHGCGAYVFWSDRSGTFYCLLAIDFLTGLEHVGLALCFALAAAFFCEAVGFGFGPFVERFFLSGSALGFFHDSHARGRFIFFVGFGAGEIGVFPNVRAEWGFVEGLYVEDDIVHARLEAGAGEVGAGSLQGVEQESGVFAVDLGQ